MKTHTVTNTVTTLWTLATAVFAVLAVRLVGASESPTPIRFENNYALSGVQFTLENSATDRKHLPETMAGGVAAFDYDGDGRTDIFFANGAEVPSLTKKSASQWNRLYRNEGGWRFRDVTVRAGLQGNGYSMAVAAADFDNDGHVDLFVAGVTRNILYRNRGDGTFEDVTAKAGITSSEWAAGAAWLDYDNDGLLDLFVVNYVRWTPEFDRFCGDQERNIRVYCHPKVFEGTSNQLYRNLGGGRFSDVSEQSGIKRFVGKGMAVSMADYDGDGFPDLFVTNDKLPNFLFHNLKDGRFKEVAFESGAALPDTGAEISSMGADFRDMNNDGLPDIALTALSGETFPLFRNNGGGQFADVSYHSRMGPLSRAYSGWGIGLFDLDNDGWKDIFTANSHVNDRVDVFEATAYLQRNSVFRNLGRGQFEDVSRLAGSSFVQSVRAHRGCAFADFDGDGRIDVITSSLSSTPEFWRNAATGAQHLASFEAQGNKK